MTTPDQDVFVRDIIFNLASVLYWRVITAKKQRQVDIDNVQENARRFMHNYAVGDLVYVGMTGIYRKIYDRKQVLYIITQVFTNDTFQFQRVKVN